MSRIALVGDGVNDGPALATARLGIALSSVSVVANSVLLARWKPARR